MRLNSYISIKSLHPNTGQIPGVPANPRQWAKGDVDRLARSIEQTPELLEARPVIVYPAGTDNYVILGGNLRFAACKQLKRDTVPCYIVQPDLGADKLKEIVIKDNGSFGAWDFDALANEWDDLPLDEWGVPALDSVPDVDEIDAIQEDDFAEEEDEIHVRCKPGDVWELGDHRLMCGDSIDLQQVKVLMGGGIADMILTDPPYNVDYSEKNKYLNEAGKGNRVQTPIENDKMSDADFTQFLCRAFTSAADALKPGGAFYVWSTQGHAQEDVALALDRARLFFRQQIVWTKNVHVLGRQDYQGKHEPCYYGWKEGNGHYFKSTRSETTVVPDAGEIDLKKMKKEEMRDLLERIFSDDVPTTVIKENKPSKSELHPTMKPVRLFGRLISNSSREGEIVLDTFGGSGTTLVACEQLGRRCYMMEIDPHYCDVIIARWEKFTGKMAQLIERTENVA